MTDYKLTKLGRGGKKKCRLHFLVSKHKHVLKKIITRFANKEVGTDHQHLEDAKTALNLHLRHCLATKKKKIFV